MITVNSDGQPISQAFEDAMGQPSISYRMRIFSGGVDTGWGIKRARLDLGAGMYDSSADIELGAILSNQMDAELYDVVGDPIGEEIEVRMGVLTGDAYEYVSMASLTVTKTSTKRGVTSISASGPISKMGGAIGASGDLSPSAAAAAIGAASGVQVAIGSFASTSTTVRIDDGATCRDALKALALRLGGFAWEDGGSVMVSPYSSEVTYALPEGFITRDPEMPDSDFSASGLAVETSSGEVVYGDGRIAVSDPSGTASTSAVQWANVGSVSFAPGEVSVALIDPRVTPEDVASVMGRSLPTIGVSITYDGGCFGTYSAPGLTGEAAAALVRGDVSRNAAEARAIAEEARATALDSAHLVITSTAGQLFKNGSESTVLQIAVFPSGGGRCDTLQDVRARFGASAYIEWRWKHDDSGTWGTLVSTDEHISHDGMWLTVTPEDVATKTTFEASLIVPD